MITLEKYLKRYHKTEILKDNDPKEYIDFLRTFKVDTNFQKSPIKYNSLFIYDVKYVDFLNNCIEYIIKNNIPNILGNGIKLKVIGFNNMPSDLIFDEITAHYLYIRDFIGWRILYSRINPRILSDIFIHLKGFYFFNNGHYQVFGFGFNKAIRFPQYLQGSVLLDNSFMFTNKKVYKPFRELAKFLPENVDKLLNEIFQGNSNIDNNQLKDLFAKVVNNHKSIKSFYYKSVLSKYCGNIFEFRNFQISYECQLKNDIFSKSVKLKLIVKSLIHIITKLFPIGVFGNSNNRKILFKNLKRFLLLKNKIAIQRFFNKSKFQLDAIYWTNNIKDFFIFVRWLFNVFIVKLLICVFHVTSSTSNPNYYYYYYHEYWNLINEEYLEKYINEYLVKLGKTNRENITYKTFPKQHDLRMVYNLHISKNYRFSKVIPVKEILKSFQIKSSNIFEVLNQFKKKSKDYYLIKFDIKNCFDSVPINKVYNIINNLISSNDIFYFNKNNGRLVHNYSEFNLDKTLSRRSYVYKNGKYFMKFKKSNFDIISFTKPEIMDIVYRFLNEYIVKINGEFYKRSKGIFQGSPLSPVFNCLFLDHLMSDISLYENSRIIKYADDFLIISDNEIKSELIFTNFQAVLAKYNMEINSNKSEILQKKSEIEHINFCGLIIDKSLTVTKNYNNSRINLNLNLKNFLIYCYNLSSLRLTFLKNFKNADNSSFIKNLGSILSSIFKIIKQYLHSNNKVSIQKFLVKYFILLKNLSLRKLAFKRKNFLIKALLEIFVRNCSYNFNLNFDMIAS